MTKLLKMPITNLKKKLHLYLRLIQNNSLILKRKSTDRSRPRKSENIETMMKRILDNGNISNDNSDNSPFGGDSMKIYNFFLNSK